MSVDLKLAETIVQQLQDWIEDRDWLSETPVANLSWSPHALQISIGDRVVYCDQGDEELSLEACKREWLEHVRSLSPFMHEALQAWCAGN